MGLQPTASNTALLLQCGRPFSKDVEIEREPPGEAANYGSALHYYLANKGTPAEACAKYNVPGCEQEIIRHGEQVRVALDAWLASSDLTSGEGLEPLIIEREKSYAVSLSRDCEGNADYDVRGETAFEEDTHTYPSLHPFQIAGTVDLLITVRRARLYQTVRIVGDYKTGQYGTFHKPAAIPQMQSLALMTGAAHALIIHCPRNAPVTIFCEPITLFVKDKETLLRALERVDDGSLRPGPACQYCPAKRSCPAFMSDVVKETNSLMRVATGAAPLTDPRDKGALHMFLTRFAALEKRARELLRSDVEAGEVIQRPDGKILTMIDKVYSNLSQASIRRALPGQAGEDMIKTLRDAGCIDEGVRTEMHAK